MDACPCHILESTKEIEMKLGLQIDCSEGKGSAPKTIILSYILTELSHHKKGCFLCHVLVYKWCWITNSCLLQIINIWGAFLASSDFLVIIIVIIVIIIKIYELTFTHECLFYFSITNISLHSATCSDVACYNCLYSRCVLCSVSTNPDHTFSQWVKRTCQASGHETCSTCSTDTKPGISHFLPLEKSTALISLYRRLQVIRIH